MMGERYVKVGRHTGYLMVVRTPERSKPTKMPKPPSDKALIEQHAQRIWRRYGDMFGDWAVAAMSDEERELYIGGGNRRLNKLAKESMEDGLAGVMVDFDVPERLIRKVYRRVLKLSHMV